MSDLLETLRGALDHVEYGVVLLDSRLNTRFMNRAFRQMWNFPEEEYEASIGFESIMQHGQRRNLYQVPPHQLPDYVADRIEKVRAGQDGPRMIRIIDGRVIKFECIALPEGGRMLTYADQTELIQAVERLETIANIDELTGIHNRRYLYSQAQEEVLRAQRYQRPFSVIMLDIDHFKRINDVHGHAAGDQVLRAIADCCRDSLRSSDLVGRIGGEEFVIALPETSVELAVAVAEKICSQIANLVIPSIRGSIRTSASLGVASLDEHCNTFDKLMQAADMAMYAAKEKGRNQVEYVGI